MKKNMSLPFTAAATLALLPSFLSCGNVIKAGDADSDGEGSCPEGQTWCEGSCVDLTNDNLNCGICGHLCQQPPNASGRCESSECVFQCIDGWRDTNDNLEDGCEYECDPTIEPNDVCNGVDDDCDGQYDEDAGECRQGDTNVVCETSCGSQGSTTCDDFCMKGDCVPPPEDCNGQDDDCDDVDDNGFPCVQGEQTDCTTSCGSTGRGTCNADCSLPLDTACTPPDETCNWLDDNCNGEIDEGLYGVVVEDIAITDGTYETGSPLIAFGESNYIIAWEDDREGHPKELYTRAVRLDGTSLSIDNQLIGNTSSENLGDLVWSNDKFAITYYSNFSSTTGYEVWVATLNANGERLDLNKSINYTSDQIYSSIVWDGSTWAISWFDERIAVDTYTVYFANINSTTLYIEGSSVSAVSASMTENTHPDIVWSGSTYAVAWNQSSGSYRNVHVRIINEDGTFDSTILLVTNNFTETFNPSILWTGSEWIVSWVGERSPADMGYYLARLDEGGDVIPSSETKIDSYSTIPVGTGTPMKIADAGGLGIGAVWQKDITDGRRDILFQRFSYDLAAIGEIITVMSDGTSEAPSLSWDGSGFGIVYTNKPPETLVSRSVHFARVGCLPPP